MGGRDICGCARSIRICEHSDRGICRGRNHGSHVHIIHCEDPRRQAAHPEDKWGDRGHDHDELCNTKADAAQETGGYRRRIGRKRIHYHPHDIYRTYHIYQVPGTDLLQAGQSGTERQDIQDVQVPKHVHGR